jgi:hypothetical protein
MPRFRTPPQPMDPRLQSSSSMSAEFVELWPDHGVGKDRTHRSAAIVPHNGVTVVMLLNGAGLTVAAQHSDIVNVKEISNSIGPAHWKKELTAFLLHEGAQFLLDFSLIAAHPSVLGADRRFFALTGRRRGGMSGASITATNPKTGVKEASLTAVVLGPRVVKVSIQPLYHLDSSGNSVAHTKLKFDPLAMLAKMNEIWNPQANVSFQLTVTSPARIKKKLNPAVAIQDIQKDLQALKSPLADFAIFQVERALDDRTPVNGVTDTVKAFCIVGDDRAEHTPAHEAGHYLGSFSGPAGWVAYGDVANSSDPASATLMGGAGEKIPFDDVLQYFNPRY